MSDAEGTTHPAIPPEVERRLEAQRDGLAAAHDAIDELREELDDTRQRVADLEELTDLQRHVQDAGTLKVEDRAAICIQTLANEAKQRQRNGQPPAASMDYNGAKKALGGGLADQQLLDALERAAGLVETPAVQFKKEKRSAKQNSRLVVDLEAGDLPSRYRTGGNSPTEGRP